MLLGKLAEHVAKVGSQRQVATFIQLLVLHSRPFAVDFAAAHAVANDEHCIRVSMISPTITILAPCPAKLGHRQDNYIIHALTELPVQRRHFCPELSTVFANW